MRYTLRHHANRADANVLEFTMLDEKYLGYRIEWATTPSQDHPTKWLGHFHAFKDSHPTVRGSLINPRRRCACADHPRCQGENR
jgi:hypothetical protein